MKPLLYSRKHHHPLRSINVMAGVILILAFCSYLSGCQSPLTADTPRILNPDIEWQNTNNQTAVSKINGLAPELSIQTERIVASTGGVVSVAGRVNPDSEMGKQALAGINTAISGVEIGNAFINTKPFRLTLLDQITIITSPQVFDWALLSVFALKTSITLLSLPLDNNTVEVPEFRMMDFPKDNTIISSATNLNIQLQKPAEIGKETEVLLYGDYRISPVIIPITPGALSGVIPADSIKQYQARSDQNSTLPFTTYFVSARVKTAKAVNSGKVALAGVSMHTVRITFQK